MKHSLTMMVVGCGLALLLIFLLPSLGLGGGWMLAVAFGALMFCHLMHFGIHKEEILNGRRGVRVSELAWSRKLKSRHAHE